MAMTYPVINEGLFWRLLRCSHFKNVIKEYLFFQTTNEVKGNEYRK